MDEVYTDLEPYDGVIGRSRYILHVRELLTAGRYQDLESLAAWLRVSPYPRFADGRPGLDAFYNGIVPTPGDLSDEKKWSEWEQIYAAWEAAHPESPTVPVARADALTSLAWSFRGNRFASHVTEAGWVGFERELARARELLDQSTTPCPHRWAILQTVALGQSWSEDDYSQLFKQITASYPDYPIFHSRATYRLLPRWLGAPGMIGAWAKQETARDPLGLGTATYAQIAIFALIHTGANYDEVRHQHGFTWAELRPSFDALQRIYPKSSSITDHALQWARLEEDKAAAHDWAARRNDHGFFGPLTYGTLQQIKDWANPAPSSIAPEAAWATPVSTIKMEPGRRKWIFDLLLVDESRVVAADLDDQLFLYSAPGLELLKAGPTNIGTVLALAPDRTRFAAANSGRVQSRIQEFDLELRPLGAPITVPGGISHFVYASGDSFIVATGGFQIPPQLVSVTRTGEITPLDWLRKSPSHMPRLDVTRTASGQRLLAIVQPRGVSIRDLDSGGELAYITIDAPGSPRALSFDTSGVNLAVLCSSYGDTAISLALIRGPNWAAEPPIVRNGPQSSTSNVSWSPDGQWLVSGGDSGSLLVWRTSGGAPLRVDENLTSLHRVKFTPEGRHLVGSTSDSTLRSWKVVH